MNPIYTITAISRLTRQREQITGLISNPDVAQHLLQKMKQVPARKRVYLRPKVEIATPDTHSLSEIDGTSDAI